MKPFFLICFTLLFFFAYAQNDVTFYNYKWEKCDAATARFFSTAEKTDSGILRRDYYVSSQKLQMVCLYKDTSFKEIAGIARYYYSNGYPESEERRVNNKTEGLSMRWHYNGMIADSANYIKGELSGIRLKWHPNGVMSDSIVKVNDSTILTVSWFDNGNPSSYGYHVQGKREGKWFYFHKNGNSACVEINEKGKVTAADFFDEKGLPVSDTSNKFKEATFKGGIEKWKVYLSNKIYWPGSFKITNANTATVVVRFTVNEDGKIENPYVSVPFHKLLDEIALKAVEKSPDWLPAYHNNRRVKAYRSQPITFTQE